MTNARDMVDGIRPPEAHKQVENAETIVSVVRKATGLYMLEQEELEDLVAEVIREEGFAEFVITTMGLKGKGGKTNDDWPAGTKTTDPLATSGVGVSSRGPPSADSSGRKCITTRGSQRYNVR
jgi:hypothetical protein